MRRLSALLLACALLLAPAAARADTDPASDILPTTDVYFPYQPAMPEKLKNDLRGLTAAAKKAGFPIKVAIAASTADLGGVPDLMGAPTRYAAYLGPEITFGKKPQPLLVVMPDGLGTFGVSAAAAKATTGIKVGSGAEGLGRAAIDGVLKMAKADGHPIKGFKPQSGGSGGGGALTAVIFGVPVALLVIALAVFSYRRTDREDDEEPEEASASAPRA